MSLRNCIALVPKIAVVYLQEWGWHYRDEWGITTLEEMIKDLVDNYLDDTLVLLQGDGNWIGTVALLQEDSKSHTHMGPWVTCLYVKPAFRRMGYGRMLVNTVSCDKDTYLWCYTEREKELYMRWGFTVTEEFTYHGKKAYVLRKEV